MKSVETESSAKCAADKSVSHSSYCMPLMYVQFIYFNHKLDFNELFECERS